MSFGDNVKKILTETAKIAVKKSGEVIETAKNKYSEFDIQSSVDSLYKELGKKVYDGYKNDSDVSDTITMLCEEIDEKMSELDDVKTKSNKFSYGIVCPGCSKTCEPDVMYCPQCGEKLQ